MMDHVENKHDNNPIQAATVSRGNGNKGVRNMSVIPQFGFKWNLRHSFYFLHRHFRTYSFTIMTFPYINIK